MVNGSISARRFQMHLLLNLAACSLLLAVIGVYGVLACSAVRTREIGIRMPLGVNRGVI